MSLSLHIGLALVSVGRSGLSAVDMRLLKAASLVSGHRGLQQEACVAPFRTAVVCPLSAPLPGFVKSIVAAGFLNAARSLARPLSQARSVHFFSSELIWKWNILSVLNAGIP